MFSGLKSDSTALSHVWLGLPAVEVVSSLMEACESQQQLYGDGLHQEHCVRCGQSVVPLPCWKAEDTLTLPWLLRLFYDECMVYGIYRSCRFRFVHRWNAKWAVEWLSLSQSVKWRPTYRLSCVSYRLFVGTARIVCRTWSVQRYHVRPSVRLSVPAWAYNNKPLLQHCRFAAVGPAGETYRSTAARPALSSSGGDCGQCHVVSRRRKWNTDLIIIRPSFLPQYVKLLGPQLDKLIC